MPEPSEPETLWVQSWGSGEPLLALHPLALESTAFAGVGARLARHGVRTIAVDLPGFGRSPAPADEPLTPARLAGPVVALARAQERPPLLVGMSLGGRVALEAALAAPESFRGIVCVAPFLPWRRGGWWTRASALVLDPDLAERVPLELAWPALAWISETLEGRPSLEHDWLARASLRVAYYLSCPATRRHFVSATREMARDPAFGPESIWERLGSLAIPAAFLWAGRDHLIPSRHADRIGRLLPAARRLEVACAGHFVNGRHFRCFEEAIATAVLRVRADASSGGRARACPPPVEHCPCLAAAVERPATAARAPVTRLAAEREDAAGPAPHPSRRRLSGEDAVFALAESETMPMHTVGTMVLAPARGRPRLDRWRLAELLQRRLHRMPPFRQRLVEIPLDLGRPLLVDDPEFSPQRHLRSAKLPPPGGPRELAALVGEIAARPLRRDRPLWEMWVVDGLEGGRQAVVAKLHHCLLDGATGATQIANLLDLSPEPPPDPPPPAWRPAPLPSRASLLAEALIASVETPGHLGRAVAATLRASAQRGRAALTGALPEAAGGWLATWPRTPLAGRLTAERAVAFARLPLAHLREIGRRFEVTLNDVLLAACGQALSEELRALDSLPDRPLVCAVPVSLKSAEERHHFSNRVSLIPVALANGTEEAGEALLRVHREAERAKAIFSAIDEELLAPWLEVVPPALVAVGSRALSHLGLASWVPPAADLVISNMAGAPVPLFLAGARVEAIYPMGPVGEGIGLNVTVLSGDDWLSIGVLTCPALGVDPWAIARGITRAVDRLAADEAPARRASR